MMLKISPLLLLSISLLFPNRAFADAGSQSNGKIKLVERSEKIVEYQLPNGLQILLAPDSSAPVATVMIVYRVGSRNEAVGYTGSTHMLEHMLFKGTPAFNKEKGTQIAAMLESVGADYNASTWLDRTNYYETLPSDKIELALQIEADRMRNSFIKDSDRQSEMTVVRNELEQGENEPSSVLETQIYATAFREHPYHHPTIGWRSDVEGAPTSRLKAFYNTFYWPNNATLILIGDFEEASSLALIEKHFGSIPSSPEPIPKVYTTEPQQQGERRFVLRRAGELPIIETAWRIPDGRNKEIYPLIVLDTVLSGGITSRLYQSLIDKQLAVETAANADRFYDPALFTVTTTVRPGVKPATVERIVRDEVEWFRENLIGLEELNRAKALIAAEFAFENDGPAGRAEHIAEAVSNGDWRIYTDFIKNIESVTPERVRETAAKYFLRDNMTVGYFEPSKEEISDLGFLPQRAQRKDENLSEFSVSSAAKISYRPAISGGKFADRIKRVPMSNGAVLLTLERKTTPTATIYGAILAGDYLDPKGKPNLAYIVAEMLNKGTIRRNKIQLAKELENIGASLDFDSNTFTLSFEGRCMAKDAEKTITLLAEQLREPSFPVAELEKLKSQIVAQLQEERSGTFEQAFQKLTQMLYDPSSPLYKPSVEARIKSVESITRKDVERFYKSHYGGASLVLVAVGDIDSEAIAKIVKDRFEGWSGGEKKRIDIPETPLPKSPQRAFAEIKDKANADIFIGNAGALKRSDSDYYAATIANHALGQSTLSSRLGLQVRDAEGLTYGIVSRFFDTGLADGPWAISVSVNPENVDKTVESSLTVLRKYVKDGISEKELEDSKGSLAGAFKVELSTNAGIAQRIFEMELFSLGNDYLDRYPALIKSVTKTQVDDAIRRHFHPDLATVVVAGEIKK